MRLHQKLYRNRSQNPVPPPSRYVPLYAPNPPKSKGSWPSSSSAQKAISPAAEPSGSTVAVAHSDLWLSVFVSNEVDDDRVRKLVCRSIEEYRDCTHPQQQAFTNVLRLLQQAAELPRYTTPYEGSQAQLDCTAITSYNDMLSPSQRLAWFKRAFELTL